MDSKIKDGHRSIRPTSKEMENVSKSKGKEKARKELWDSLCAVYENEANKENGEVDVSELEDWTVTNPDTSMRALTQLAVTKPQILSAAVSAFSDDADLTFELELQYKKELYEKQVNERKTKKRGLETSKKCRCKSSLSMKSTKTHSSVKVCIKPRAVPRKERLSVSLTRSKIEGKKTKCTMKLQKPTITEEKKKRRHKLTHAEESKENINDFKVPKSGIKQKKFKLKTREESYPNHKCKLEYRYYLSTRNICTRPDNRVFNCKLIFKVCHCTESDVVL